MEDASVIQRDVCSLPTGSAENYRQVCCGTHRVHRSIVGPYQFKQYKLHNTLPCLKRFYEYCQKSANCPPSGLLSTLRNHTTWSPEKSPYIKKSPLDRHPLAWLYCTSLPSRNEPIGALAKFLGTHTNCYIALSEEVSWSHQADQRKQPGAGNGVGRQQLLAQLGACNPIVTTRGLPHVHSHSSAVEKPT